MENNSERIVKLTVRLPLTMHEILSTVAAEDHRSRHSLILKVIDDYLKSKVGA